MKKVFVIALAAAMFTSCGFLQNATSSSTSSNTTTASTSTANGVSTGRAAGTALDALYSQYKATGKIDCGNISNLLSIAQLVAACQELKTNKGNSSYTKEFTQGLVLSSVNVEEINKTTVTNSLASLAENIDTSAITSSINTAIANGQTTISDATTKATETVTTAATKASQAASTVNTIAGNVNDVANSITSILSLFK